MSDTSATAPKQSSGLAIAGLVLGILAAATSFLPIINNLSAVIAVIGGVLATIALVGAVRGKHTAKGQAIAGVVLAVVSFAVVLGTQSAYSAALDSAMEKATTGARPIESSEGAGAAEQTASETSAPQADSQKDYSSLSVGETVSLSDGLSVAVNSVQTGLANYDGSLVTCINVTYTNNGSGNASFNAYDWKGEDANGAQRSVTFFSDESNALNSGTLSAGGTVTGNIYFDDGVTRVFYYSNVFNSSPAAGWAL